MGIKVNLTPGQKLFRAIFEPDICDIPEIDEEQFWKLIPQLFPYPRMVSILELRFGRITGSAMRLSDIAELTPRLNGTSHVGAERIRQIESKALRLLRHPTRKQKIRQVVILRL